MGDQNIPPSQSAPVISLTNIRGFGHNDVGMFKMSGDLFGWKNKRTGVASQYKGSEVMSAEWIKTSGTSCQLRVKLNTSSTNNIIRFDGFLEKNFMEISRHFSSYLGVKLERLRSTTRGWHWGEYELSGGVFTFKIDEKRALEISANDVNQVNIPSKTDISIELRTDETETNTADELMEIRFYRPPKGDTNDEVENPLELIRQQLSSSVHTPDFKVESVVMLTDVHILVPRGRFEIDLGKKFMKFHGKSYDFTIQYESVNRMFLVPKPNSPHVIFVIGLTKAVRQGQTQYPFIVMQFESEAETSLDINMSTEELKQLQLEHTLEGNACDVVTRLFKALVGRVIVVPGDFKNMNDSSGVTCSYRAASGHLYPLNKSLLFIVKPVIFIRDEDINLIQFSRISQNRYFSFTVNTKPGIEYEFTSIDRHEYQLLYNFFNAKGLKIKNKEDSIEQQNGSLADNDLPSDTDDDNFNSNDEESEDDDYADKNDKESDGDDDDEDEEDEEDEE